MVVFLPILVWYRRSVLGLMNYNIGAAERGKGVVGATEEEADVHWRMLRSPSLEEESTLLSPCKTRIRLDILATYTNQIRKICISKCILQTI